MFTSLKVCSWTRHISTVFKLTGGMLASQVPYSPLAHWVSTYCAMIYSRNQTAWCMLRTNSTHRDTIRSTRHRV
jgi:hypothetical protein